MKKESCYFCMPIILQQSMILRNMVLAAGGQVKKRMLIVVKKTLQIMILHCAIWYYFCYFCVSIILQQIMILRNMVLAASWRRQYCFPSAVAFPANLTADRKFLKCFSFQTFSSWKKKNIAVAFVKENIEHQKCKTGKPFLTDGI